MRSLRGYAVVDMNTSSRRKFVIGGLATAAAVGLAGCDGGGSGQMKAPAVSLAPPLTLGEVDRWEKLLGETFVITAEVGKTVAKLTAIQRGTQDPGRPPELGRALPFYVYFETDLRLVPEGGKTYQVSHSSTGAFDLFVGRSPEQDGKGVFHALLN